MMLDKKKRFFFSFSLMFGKIWVNELNSADKIPVTSLFDQQEQPAEIYLPKRKMICHTKMHCIT
jgi:hypothetical protein